MTADQLKEGMQLMSEDMERATLGAVLLKPDTFHILNGIVKPTDFFNLRYSYIWQAICKVARRGDPIDEGTVHAELEAQKWAKQIGSPGILSDVVYDTPNSDHGFVYASIVARYSIRRDILKATDEMRTLAHNMDLGVEDVITQSQGVFNQGVVSRLNTNDESSFKDLAQDFTDRLQFMMDHPDEITGVSTGLKDLDRIIKGLDKDELVLIAGRPGMGKTALALLMALEALRKGLKVGLFSLEMGADQFFQRLVALDSEVPYSQQKSGRIDQLEYKRVLNSARSLSNMNSQAYLYDVANITPETITAKATQWKHQAGIDVLFIDYIQLMNATGFKPGDETAKVSHISKSLKQLARTLHIPIVALAQLNRDCESRQDKRPMLSDLKQSGSLEQDADKVVFVYRDVVYNENTENPNQAELIVGKHRNGPTGTAKTFYDAPIMKFKNAVIHSYDLGKGAINGK